MTTIILIPFLFAFLVFAARFYLKERADSKLNPSFLLAAGTLIVVAVYLTLGMTRSIPDYGTIAFGVTGVLLLAFSIFRLMQF